MNAAWAAGPGAPSVFAVIQCVPGSAEAGTWTAIGPKLPVALVVVNTSSLVSKYRSTASEAPNPAPETRTVVVGGPTDGDSDTLALTVKR